MERHPYPAMPHQEKQTTEPTMQQLFPQLDLPAGYTDGLDMDSLTAYTGEPLMDNFPRLTGAEDFDANRFEIPVSGAELVDTLGLGGLRKALGARKDARRNRGVSTESGSEEVVETVDPSTVDTQEIDVQQPDMSFTETPSGLLVAHLNEAPVQPEPVTSATPNVGRSGSQGRRASTRNKKKLWVDSFEQDKGFGGVSAHDVPSSIREEGVAMRTSKKATKRRVSRTRHTATITGPYRIDERTGLSSRRAPDGSLSHERRKTRRRIRKAEKVFKKTLPAYDVLERARSNRGRGA